VGGFLELRDAGFGVKMFESFSVEGFLVAGFLFGKF